MYYYSLEIKTGAMIMIAISKYHALRCNYGNARVLNTIKYIIIHYTANDGDTALSNAKYFARGNRGASAHYFVDSNNIVQSVEDNYVAWSVGGSKYSDCSKTGGGKFYGICNNSNSINIELCDDIKNGNIYPTEAAISNAIDLVRSLMEKYNISSNNVIRHFDVNGKRCPAYWCGDSQKNGKWQKFKNSILEEEQIMKQNIKINGKIKTVDAINKDGYTYIKIRGLSDILNIDYDKETKLISVSVK